MGPDCLPLQVPSWNREGGADSEGERSVTGWDGASGRKDLSEVGNEVQIRDSNSKATDSAGP